MISGTLRASFLAAFLATPGGPALAEAAPASALPTVLQSGAIPAPHLLTPEGDAKAVVLLLSDAAGWGGREDATARALADKGAFVMGIDLPSWLAALEKDNRDGDDGECVYTLSDIELLSQQMQRSGGSRIYRLPIVAGVGAGGAMALAIAAQTPPATVQQTIAVDPAAGIALRKPLCTPAARRQSGDLAVYGLTEGPLPSPITVELTDGAPADGRAHVETELAAAHPAITVEDGGEDAWEALGDALDAAIETPASEALGLPIDVLETAPTHDTMAVIYSGDGGWRDLDKEIGEAFQASGVPTIGVDSLRYFWSARTPAETSGDLKRIIDLYAKRWGVRNVVLVGYSFGADVLPTAYNLLPAPEKAKVKDIALLALSDEASFEISVTGWLGVGAGDAGQNTAEMKRIDPSIVQCIYGTDDEDSVCPALKNLGITLVAIEGGHHFDGDYPALAKRILAAAAERIRASKTP